MKVRLLTSLAATSLVAGTIYVAAEGAGPSPGTTEPKTGTQPKATEPKAKPEPKGTQAQPQTPKIDEPKTKAVEPKSKAAEPKTKAEEPRPKAAEPKTKDTTKDASPKTGEPKTKDGAPTQPKTGEKPRGDQVTITTQQRTEIRQVITQTTGAPRVTNVNFNIAVGTVVPRTVTVAVLPPRVVEIYPAWRGYRYFIVGERIIIIDDDYQIVFIIDT